MIPTLKLPTGTTAKPLLVDGRPARAKIGQAMGRFTPIENRSGFGSVIATWHYVVDLGCSVGNQLPIIPLLHNNYLDVDQTVLRPDDALMSASFSSGRFNLAFEQAVSIRARVDYSVEDGATGVALPHFVGDSIDLGECGFDLTHILYEFIANIYQISTSPIEAGGTLLVSPSEHAVNTGGLAALLSNVPADYPNRARFTKPEFWFGEFGLGGLTYLSDGNIVDSEEEFQILVTVASSPGVSFLIRVPLKTVYACVQQPIEVYGAPVWRVEYAIARRFAPVDLEGADVDLSDCCPLHGSYSLGDIQDDFGRFTPWIGPTVEKVSLSYRDANGDLAQVRTVTIRPWDIAVESNYLFGVDSAGVRYVGLDAASSSAWASGALGFKVLTGCAVGAAPSGNDGGSSNAGSDDSTTSNSNTVWAGGVLGFLAGLVVGSSSSDTGKDQHGGR